MVVSFQHAPAQQPTNCGLSRLPVEVLSRIGLYVSRCGSGPGMLVPLLGTCQRIYGMLSLERGNEQLYGSIFNTLFDVGAVSRRAFQPRAKDLVEQLVKQCQALRVIRRGDVHDFDVVDAMETGLMMMLEDDGKNRNQLEGAGAYHFARRWLMSCMVRDADGYPDVHHLRTTSTVLWLMYMLTTQAVLDAEVEDPAISEDFIQLILPLVLNPFRYAATYAPPSYFPLSAPPDPSRPPSNTYTAHGPFPPDMSAYEATYHHYGSCPVMTFPPAPLAATLLFFARRERDGFPIPPHFRERRTRDEIARGVIGPTRADLREFNAFCAVDLHEDPPDSTRWDADWWRTRLCRNPFARAPRLGRVYEPGSLDGLWQGRMLIPASAALGRIAQLRHLPPGFSEESLDAITQPTFMRLQEHHCIRGVHATAIKAKKIRPTRKQQARRASPRPWSDSESDSDSEPDDPAVIPPGAPTDGDGMRNAWLPGNIGECSVRQINQVGTSTSRLRDEVRVSFPTIHGTRTWVYETFDRGGTPPARGGDNSIFVHPEGVGETTGMTTAEIAAHFERIKAEHRSSAGPPPKESRHDPDSCPGCARDEEMRRQERLERMQSDGWDSDVEYEFSADESEDEEELEEDEGGSDLEADGEQMFEDIGLGRNSPCNCGQHHSDSSDMDMEDSEEEEEEEEEDMDEDEDEEMKFAEPIPALDNPVAEGMTPHIDFNTQFASTLPKRRPRTRKPDILDGGRTRLYDRDGTALPLYRRAHARSHTGPACDGVRDILVTGTTDPAHGHAWNHFIYHGRVRAWDGLVGLLRSPAPHAAHLGLGHMLFYGYIVGGKTLVGRWRVTQAQADAPAWEGPFVLGRR
ncbi:hypothetical protein BD779DRAFT_286787 [Infundibulicybe gibba]|nr:hypothetical protein BD779DRAFT_286787 [Infundibulicybe gibba]